jgi:ribose 5-phosphate isomerase B
VRISIGSDHGGYALKEALARYVAGLGHEVRDHGCHSTDPVDFPDIAFEVASAVARGAADRGVVVDGVGSASAMVANKVPGVRAHACHDDFTVRMSREHSDANVFCLGARVVDEATAKALVERWLRTPFLGGRYRARVEKIAAVERRAAGVAPRRRVVTAADVAGGDGGAGAILTPAAREALAAAAPSARRPPRA